MHARVFLFNYHVLINYLRTYFRYNVLLISIKHEARIREFYFI